MDREYVERITKKLIADGRLIEAGWVCHRAAAIPMVSDPAHIEEMHAAFFAGAQHVFAIIVGVYDPKQETIEDDVQRLYLVGDELTGFVQEYELMHSIPKGSG
jgi:hypothetical protein